MTRNRHVRGVVLLLLLVMLGGVWGFFLFGDRWLDASRSDVASGVPTGERIDGPDGMRFVAIPSGGFVMGSPETEDGRNPDESPARGRRVAAFYLMDGEVTVRQFAAFVEATGYVTDAEKDGFSWIYTGEWEKRPSRSWTNPGFDQTPENPVVHVSLRDAVAMADWLTDTASGRYRLPTEVEWEYAARAGTRTSRYWGESMDRACAYANVADATAMADYPGWVAADCSDGVVHTAPVRSFAPNAYGLYDMLGNVWEWTDTRYTGDGYKGRAPKAARAGKPVVIRGGSWYSRPEFVRSASRDRMATPLRRGQDIGFRLVRE